LRRQAGDARQKALEDLNRLVDQADTEKATMDTQLD
jgi:rubrerythrin